MDEGYEKILRVVGKRHDFIGIVMGDKREDEIPKMGLVKFTDAETGEERWIDTNDLRMREHLLELRKKITEQRKSLFIKSRLDSIEIQTGQNYVKPLVQFFRVRGKRW
jgi:hypothetical protein